MADVDTTHEDNIIKKLEGEDVTHPETSEVALGRHPSSTKLSPLVVYNQRHIMRCVSTLQANEIDYLMSHLDEQLVHILDKIVPGLPFLLWLKEKSRNGEFEHPTVKHFREFRDQYLRGEVSFPWSGIDVVADLEELENDVSQD
jgi:hypothetical protein